MDPNAVELMLKAHLREIRTRMEEAANLAKAAEACSEAGSLPKAVEIVLSVEQLLYEATTLLNGASLMLRIYRGQAS